MAYKDSDQIANDSNYALGEYSFRIERSSIPGSTNDKIEAICTDKDGKNARKSIQVSSLTQFSGWYVEANGETADVYVIVQSEEGASGGLLPPGGSVQVGSQVGSVTFISDTGYAATIGYSAGSVAVGWYHGSYPNEHSVVIASTIPTLTVNEFGFITSENKIVESTHTYSGYSVDSRTYDGKTVYYRGLGYLVNGPICAGGATLSGITSSYVGAGAVDNGDVAWTMIYGTISDGEPEMVLVGRFKIDLEEAGGVGPGSDWEDPGDYDPDWEEGDPTHTLYVEVTGALSGRHNDPIVDPSYSYIPADKDTVKQYGCGGDGGHGGGGGAGASTVVVHKFATNQANSKEVTAIARRHGYGSGGGKGGKGGDGCILVYY